MVLEVGLVTIAGAAGTAAGALLLYRRVSSGEFGEAGEVIRVVRQTTGVVLAVANFLRSLLDALQLVRARPMAAATGPSSGLRIIGGRAPDDDD